MVLDIPSVGTWVAVSGAIAGLYKLSIDNRALREQVRKNSRDIQKTDEDATAVKDTASAAQIIASSQVLVSANETAAKWMEKFAGVLEKLGEANRKIDDQARDFNAKLTAQDAKLLRLEKAVEELKSEKEGLERKHRDCQSELKQTLVKLSASETARIALEKKIEASEEACQQYKAGYDAAMLLFEATNGAKSDEPILKIAQETIRRVSDFERSDTRAITTVAAPAHPAPTRKK